MTLMFWLIASAMTVLVLGLLLWPLLKRTAAATGEQEKTLSVYRQQFAELEQDRTNGLLTDEQYKLSRHELERRLLEETGATETMPTQAWRQVNSRLVALALAMIIPTASGVLYWTLGNPLAMTHPTAPSTFSQGSSEDALQGSGGLAVVVEQLKKKLEQNPSDGVGWVLLARSYMAMGRHADAVPIYEKAVKLNPDNAQLLVDYADALGIHQGRKLEGKPDGLIQRALKIDPHNVKALMLAGTVSFNRKNYARAAKDWEQARANLPADAEPEAAQELTASIAEAQRRLDGSPTMMTANAALAAPAKPTGQIGSSRAISGTVTLAPSLAGKGSSTDTLFVFARAVNGPPMPVAIVRATKNDLPFTFRLDDSTSPMPSRKLSDVGTVVIVARLSKSGRAMPESGDLEGMSQPVKPGVEGITIVIDRERPSAPAKPTQQIGSSRAISGTVTLTPSLAGKGSSTDTLFVFARAVNGPPMPVAIVRATKNDLPFTFRLDDSTSPMPSRKLSDVGTVVIVARLSKSGRAMPESGDLEGMSQPVKPGVEGITVVIDRERP